ncbi:hypothetical protein GGE65_003880 [Skermanella aerolata]|jgi:hypothetical protein|uniref:DUF2934 domain-containing protein n=1 Tax=Skermanella aerolata TaxID=393310 RepID=A0A512DQU4_9PROT|nr:DUF2934 domain-containing protein [Skermanella aerolata]GEO38872.1 hypothetical protein SAE02_30200 [Skermanella aerolata]
MSLIDDVEKRVKQRAYEIWEREGCPEGREADHWALAKEEVAIEDNQSQALMPNPSQGGDDTVVHPEPVEPLLAAENLGEDTGGPTNQSEEQPLPKKTRARRPSGTETATTTRTRKGKAKE